VSFLFYFFNLLPPCGFYSHISLGLDFGFGLSLRTNYVVPAQHDSPWEHVPPPQHPHLAAQARPEKGVFLSGTKPLELLPPGDLHGQLNSSESTSPMSAYSSESIHSPGYESGNSPPLSTKEWEYSSRENSSWSIPSLAPRGRSAGATSPSQGNSISHRPRPFSRKSKAGNQHTVTPSAAGPEGGFICRFKMGGSACGRPFKLPSDIRFV